MALHNIDPTTLISYTNAVAGHDGTLSDPSGLLFVKPCTAEEIAFYETANASYSDLVAFMPTYMGTLTLSNPTEAELQALASQANGAQTDNVQPRIQMLPSNHAAAVVGSHIKGKKLVTDQHVVLGNLSSGFAHPNILDLKLGSRLWDEDAPAAKRARLDAVSAASTSSSLGFRIAGMRVWQGAGDLPLKQDVVTRDLAHLQSDEDGSFLVYNKMFGRSLTLDTVSTGIRDFLLVPCAGIQKEHALALLSAFEDGLCQLVSVLENMETRMYSASVLLVYEGDGKVFDEKFRRTQEEEQMNGKDSAVDGLEGAIGTNGVNGAVDGTVMEDGEYDQEDDDEGEDEDEDKNRLLTVKLIDFAHASFVPGQGPDENVLHGLRSIIKILGQLQEELDSDVDRN
ncbi:SAICAR synthase-like protein [Microthyrium microscopicum]|uniref:Kinase n=1 Tax=Microthyrium microscopicum TaxID=703497 RepID=A0A6A6UJE9_9PEZI|nr:SAICAR synthase-like protein [Microthyrium microscopicum]